MKPKYTFSFLLIYVIMSFTWWNYALIDLNTQNYGLRFEVLQAQVIDAKRSVYANAMEGKFNSPKAKKLVHNSTFIAVDFDALKGFISINYPKLLLKCYDQKISLLDAYTIEIHPQLLDELDKKKERRRNGFIGEGIFFLAILVYGLYSVWRSIAQKEHFNQQQNNFLLSVTHELNSPLAAAKINIQTLQRHNLTDEQRQKLSKNALIEIDRLANLTEKILISTKIDTNSYTFPKETFDLSASIEKNINRYKLLATHQIESHIEPNINYYGDAFAMDLVLTNLIENALKYSEKESKISIKLIKNKVQNRTIFSIADEGIGISRGEKKYVFDKFFRIGKEEIRQTKGTGLGLFIVKTVLKQHNAHINIKDNLPKGSIFEVVF